MFKSLQRWWENKICCCLKIEIKDNLNFDQLIWEFGDDKNPNWVHVSFVSEDKNRNRCLMAYKENGRTRYKTI